jgi:hypothetical protein
MEKGKIFVEPILPDGKLSCVYFKNRYIADLCFDGKKKFYVLTWFEFGPCNEKRVVREVFEDEKGVRDKIEELYNSPLLKKRFFIGVFVRKIHRRHLAFKTGRLLRK